MKTLYNLTKDDAKTLMEAMDGNIETLAVALYVKKRASDMKRAIYKAQKIKKFANS